LAAVLHINKSNAAGNRTRLYTPGTGLSLHSLLVNPALIRSV